MHLGCEDAGGLCMSVSDGGGVQFAVALEVHISFSCREDGFRVD